MTAWALRDIGRLVTQDPALGILEGAAVVVEGERVAWIGAEAELPPVDRVESAGGRCVLPGWVDSHSHPVFAGDRSAEFAARMAGEPYRAGGIMATVTPTRQAAFGSAEPLVAGARTVLADMVAGGTTCVEAKTGYGLDPASEAAAVRAAHAAGADEITFLGAHLVPAEYQGRTDDYLDLVCGPMLDAVLAVQADGRPLVRWIDVFCERGAFDAEQSERVLLAGQAAGLGLRVHGNQLGTGPGVQLAVRLGAASVDHCTYLDEEDVQALAGSDTVATLLPLCDLSTRQPAAPGRRLLDAGATVALASNCNPGTSYTTAMNLVVGLAVLQCELSVGEAVRAATLGGAQALRRTDVGHLGVGARADLHVLNAPSEDYLAYRPGMPLTAAVYRRGERVV